MIWTSAKVKCCSNGKAMLKAKVKSLLIGKLLQNWEKSALFVAILLFSIRLWQAVRPRTVMKYMSISMHYVFFYWIGPFDSFTLWTLSFLSIQLLLMHFIVEYEFIFVSSSIRFCLVFDTYWKRDKHEFTLYKKCIPFNR